MYRRIWFIPFNIPALKYSLLMLMAVGPHTTRSKAAACPR
jgi:hypothetical protein